MHQLNTKLCVFQYFDRIACTDSLFNVHSHVTLRKIRIRYWKSIYFYRSSARNRTCESFEFNVREERLYARVYVDRRSVPKIAITCNKIKENSAWNRWWDHDAHHVVCKHQRYRHTETKHPENKTESLSSSVATAATGQQHHAVAWNRYASNEMFIAHLTWVRISVLVLGIAYDGAPLLPASPCLLNQDYVNDCHLKVLFDSVERNMQYETHLFVYSFF